MSTADIGADAMTRLPRISREQSEIFSEDRAVAPAVDQFEGLLRRVAGRMEDVDPDDADDLVQEALIRLWQMGPSRYEARDEPYVRNRLMWRMRDAWRKESRRAGLAIAGPLLRWP
jgi:DNA-directed RNA polymerase specialized sigma24 family protein